MKFYKDQNNSLFAYEADGSQDSFIPGHLVAISFEEAEQIRKSRTPSVTAEEIERRRQAAYQQEADPLFFKAQRGGATMEEWKAKIAEIKARFPMPA